MSNVPARQQVHIIDQSLKEHSSKGLKNKAECDKSFFRSDCFQIGNQNVHLMHLTLLRHQEANVAR